MSSLDVKLAATNAERERYDVEADIFSLLLACENLEKLYIRDIIQPEEYTPVCQKLIAQFKTSMNALERTFDLRSFMQEYEISCPAAYHRLYEVGVPATTEHTQSAPVPGSGGRSSSGDGKYVAQIVHGFVTLIDSLRLNLTAVDQIHPLLSDLLRNLNRYPDLPQTYQGKGNIKNWLISLNKMKASEQLDQESIRQLIFDVEQAHNEFYQLMSDK